MAMAKSIRIGTAGWAVPRTVADAFPREGSGLQRYAARFDAAEINSTFYRPHGPATWARWRDTTPESFRFAVKVPKAVTHVARLVACEAPMAAFLDQVSHLGEKLGPLLVQLPPSLAFEAAEARAFFAHLRGRFAGAAVCEPRHPSWFEGEADAMLVDLRIGRVAADPAPHPAARRPGGWTGLGYWRWHGSPRMYFSAYGEAPLAALAEELSASASHELWCMFDNTASGAAAADALLLQRSLLSGRELTRA